MSAVLDLTAKASGLVPFAPTVSLVAAARTYLYDTSLNTGESPATSAVGTRGVNFPGGSSVFYVRPTTQGVTVYQEELDSGGTWRITNNNGSGDAVAAAEHARFVFRPNALHHRAYVINGGTGPSALGVGGYWVPDRVPA